MEAPFKGNEPLAAGVVAVLLVCFVFFRVQILDFVESLTAWAAHFVR
jgi:hypothetical protein